MLSRFAFLILLVITRSAFALDYEVVFNEPGFNGQPSYTIENKLIELVDKAANDSEIHLTIFQLDRKPLIEALIRASHRGVGINMTLDGGNYFDKYKPGKYKPVTAMDLLIDGSGETGRIHCKTKPCIHFCSGPIHIKIKGQTFGSSCNGLIINHNKFFLFSKLVDGNENVVVQSSSNIDDQQMHEYQDLIAIKNDRALYEGFLDYWAMLNRDRFHLDAHKDVNGDGPVTAKFFPRILKRDPIMRMLRKVSCEAPNSTIRIAEADFNRVNVAAKLRDLAQQGCDVKVITRNEPSMRSPGEKAMHRLGKNVIILPFQGKTEIEQATNSIHTKLILIDANIDHSANKRQIVLTGSHNIDFFSLHTNDETLLAIEDTQVYDDYLAFWNRINDAARASDMRIVTGENWKNEF